MPDYLTKRNGFWQFARRVPLEFAALDPRKVIKHSTHVEVRTDRRGTKAGRVADQMNRDLEVYWKSLAEGRAAEAAERYATAKRTLRTLGKGQLEYIEANELAARPVLEIVKRYRLLKEQGLTEDPLARAAVFGQERRPSIRLTEIYPKYEDLTRNDVKDMSPDQLQRWKNGYKLAISDFIEQVGSDKEVNDLTHDDILEYVNWLEGRVEEEEIVSKTANKYIGHNSKMFKAINRRHRLGLPDFFSGLRLQNGPYVQRPPFPIDFVQKSILAEGALMELNDEARRAVMLIADSGLRLAEAVNLNEGTIFLEGDIPFVRVMPDGRRVKTQDSIRDIPLVGAALAAVKLQPKGFPRYLDKGASFSGYVNGFLREKNLRPTLKHSVYSLRHTFEDRLKATKAADSMIDELMGHSSGKGYKYGSGHPLNLKQEVLHRIAFTPPTTL